MDLLIDLIWILLAYLIGSVNVPILAARLRGFDIRTRDIAGSSGVFRQVGVLWGVGVLLLEVGKGALAAYAGLQGSYWILPLCAAAVIVGHIWPVFFGFKGGGGLAAGFGFMLAIAPGPALTGFLVTGIMVGIYFLIWKKDRLEGLGSLPFGAIFGFVYAAVVLWPTPQLFFSLLALVAVIGYRGALVLSGRWK
jgi:acyl phosphate:glycerol-3-phosphate acyltransferase